LGSKSRATATVIAVLGLVFAAGRLLALPAFVVGAAGYACTAIMPGLALSAFIGARRAEVDLAALALGPVVTGVVVAILVLAGAPLHASATTAGILFAAAALAATTRRQLRTPVHSTTAGNGTPKAVWVAAAAFVAALLVFPMLGEASRMRSDAWFHSAVMKEISAFGLPPTDPYFAGMRLQYMWLYHVYVAAISAATGASDSWAMALVNLQALACFVVAAFAVAKSLRGDGPGALISAVFAPLGLNCLFWAFVPAKLLKGAFGEVRGWDEVSRQLSLSPFSAEKARAFTSIFKSQPFLLDKFIVATAFSIGIALTVSFYFFAQRYVAGGKRPSAVLACVALAGLLLIHTPAGIAAAGSAGAALLVTALTSKKLRRRAWTLLAFAAVACASTVPYLYSVASGKEPEQLVPVGFSAMKTAAVLISCAGALILALPWVARFVRSRENPQYFYALLALAALLVSLLIVLPGPNVYDKPPYFAYLPLAPLAGWNLHSLCAKGSTRGRRAAIAALCAIAVLPNTALLYAAYVADTGPVRARPDELEMYDWVGANTQRDAVFLENGDRVGMVVLGPRRLIWGHDSYAYQWGYDKKEMERRRALRDRVFSGTPLSEEDARELSSFGGDVYVVVRMEDFDDESAAVFRESPFLSLVHSDRCAEIYKVISPAGPR